MRWFSSRACCGAGPLITKLIDWRWPGARASGVARTRLIDDLLAQALASQIEQVVILGAGYDCRAYRLPLLVQARVFEVDQASTLTAKRQRLGQVLHGLPPSVSFVEVDFNQQHPEGALEAAGYRGDLRTCFIWEGVTNYLTAAAVDGTLRWIGSAAAGSRVLFTYVQRSALASATGRKRLSGLLRRCWRALDLWLRLGRAADVSGAAWPAAAQGYRFARVSGSLYAPRWPAYARISSSIM